MKSTVKRFTITDKKKLRNLVQYKNMSDDEFDIVWEERKDAGQQSADFETLISKKLLEFEDDYDLSDMKVNDMAGLRALIQLSITLEDYEQKLYKHRTAIDGDENIQYVKKLTEIMSDIRGDISKIQTDLKITRKVRTSDKDLSVVAFLDSLKQKAKKHYESRMCYVFCPKCDMLLGTVWSLYPTKSKYSFVCQRPLENGKKCNHKFTVTIEELLKQKGTNSPEIIPEAML